MAIFVNLSPISSHFHSLQVENSDSNSRLVVDENDTGKFRLERVNKIEIFLVRIEMHAAAIFTLQGK